MIWLLVYLAAGVVTAGWVVRMLVQEGLRSSEPSDVGLAALFAIVSILVWPLVALIAAVGIGVAHLMRQWEARPLSTATKIEGAFVLLWFPARADACEAAAREIVKGRAQAGAVHDNPEGIMESLTEWLEDEARP